MPQQQDQNSLDYVLSVTSRAGIKRDGTVFDGDYFTDGTWCRFQRSKPRKIGGYQRVFKTSNGIPRQIIAQNFDGQLYAFAGHSNGVDAFTSGLSIAEGQGPFIVQILDTYAQRAVASVVSQTSFTVAMDMTALYVVGQTITFVNEVNPTTYIVASSTFANNVTTVVTTTAFTGTPTMVWAYNTSPFAPSDDIVWQFDIMYNPAKKANQLIAHPGRNLLAIDSAIPASIYAGDVIPTIDPTTNILVWSMSVLADETGQNPTFQVVRTDGGICCLYPFLFAYGSSGLVLNNNVTQTTGLVNDTSPLTDWNGALANQANSAAGKFVKGFNYRGGTNSPSGILFATDSLVRVSFNPGNVAFPWTYDLIGPINLLSSNCIVRAGANYYWIGTTNFWVFNGQIKQLDNDINLNWFFDNLNFGQRQKVWAYVNQRYNEVWWHYARGTASECTDAIIYNYKDNIWYDAGSAVGARRSCGFNSEVLPYPLLSGYDNITIQNQLYSTIATPSGQTPTTSSSFYVAGDQAIVFVPGTYVQLTTVGAPFIQVVSATFVIAAGINATYVVLASPLLQFAIPPNTAVRSILTTGQNIWVHENGFDAIDGAQISAVYSSIETSQKLSITKQNEVFPTHRSRISKFEPNFNQVGTLRLTVVGQSYVSSELVLSDVFDFTSEDEKVDIRNAEYRLWRLRFESASIGGFFEMGVPLLTISRGAPRP